MILNFRYFTKGLMKKIVLLFLIRILSGCSFNNLNSKNNMENKKILMVIAPMDFQEQEFFEPRNIFEKNKIEVSVASIQSGVATGTQGAEINIDLTASEVEVGEFNAVVFVGGAGMGKIVDDDSLKILAQKFYKAEKIVAAICVASAILAKAGILEDKNITGWEGIKDNIVKAKGNYTGRAVEIDNNIITADGPGSAKKFGEAIIKIIK